MGAAHLGAFCRAQEFESGPRQSMIKTCFMEEGPGFYGN